MQNRTGTAPNRAKSFHRAARLPPACSLEGHHDDSSRSRRRSSYCSPSYRPRWSSQRHGSSAGLRTPRPRAVPRLSSDLRGANPPAPDPALGMRAPSQAHGQPGPRPRRFPSPRPRSGPTPSSRRSTARMATSTSPTPPPTTSRSCPVERSSARSRWTRNPAAWPSTPAMVSSTSTSGCFGRGPVERHLPLRDGIALDEQRRAVLPVPNVRPGERIRLRRPAIAGLRRDPQRYPARGDDLGRYRSDRFGLRPPEPRPLRRELRLVQPQRAPQPHGRGHGEPAVPGVVCGGRPDHGAALHPHRRGIADRTIAGRIIPGNLPRGAALGRGGTVFGGPQPGRRRGLREQHGLQQREHPLGAPGRGVGRRRSGPVQRDVRPRDHRHGRLGCILGAGERPPGADERRQRHGRGDPLLRRRQRLRRSGVRPGERERPGGDPDRLAGGISDPVRPLVPGVRPSRPGHRGRYRSARRRVRAPRRPSTSRSRTGPTSGRLRRSPGTARPGTALRR